jgi:hypothetical protein
LTPGPPSIRAGLATGALISGGISYYEIKEATRFFQEGVDEIFHSQNSSRGKCP